jgi:preprotein translocase subunit YajC
MMVLLFALMYFILIRPQKKKEKEQQAMQRAVQVGDEVITIGGIVGLVVRVDEDSVLIETGGDRHKMRLKSWAIQENVTVKEDNERAKAAAAEEAKKKKEEKKKKKNGTDEDGVLKD